jgi:hypothetical protein
MCYLPSAAVRGGLPTAAREVVSRSRGNTSTPLQPIKP